MSLITCPYCGKKVSDTVKVCIHCGHTLKEEPPEKNNYNLLSKSEKKKLRFEFNRICPEFEKTRKPAVVIFVWVLCIVVIILFWAALLYFRFNPPNLEGLSEEEQTKQLASALGVIFFLFVLMLIFGVIRSKLAKKYRRKYLVCLKKYQQWIIDTKDMDYDLKLFSKKEQKYFDNINLTYKR